MLLCFIRQPAANVRTHTCRDINRYVDEPFVSVFGAYQRYFREKTVFCSDRVSLWFLGSTLSAKLLFLL